MIETIGLVEGGWCILRTAPALTLRLASALREAGFEAWTPIEISTRRVSRTRLKVEQSTPITPSFVFAPFADLSALIALARSPAQSHLVWDKRQRRMVHMGLPYFTVFRSMGAYPRVSDASLNPLRLIERQRKPAVKPTVFRRGDEVLFPDAGFEGLVGKVEGSRGKFALVLFPGMPIAVLIDPRYLQPALRAA